MRAHEDTVLRAEPARRARHAWHPGTPATRLATLLTLAGFVAMVAPHARRGSELRAQSHHRRSGSRDSDSSDAAANVSLTTSSPPSSAAESASDTAMSTTCERTRHRSGVDLSVYTYELDSNSSTQICLSLNNDYERQLGIPIGDGIYPFALLAEMHQNSRLMSYGGLAEYPHEFEYLDEDDSAESIRTGDHESTVVFKRLGTHQVHIHNGPLTAEFEVTAKYVRRELRDLTDDDRSRYFAALSTLYNVDQEDGERIYGSSFKSIGWLVREHLYGAADKACDHWHDDAGFVNHHVGITMQLEKALQTVDASVAAHYWDYTVDAELADWTTSTIFDDAWFGPASPNNTAHIVDSGTWAYTKVMERASDFSAIHNPYGLLRSPWNTNPTPYITRSRYVLGLKDSGYGIPSCAQFQDAISVKMWIGTAFTYLNGLLHGPVHIMTGGHWYFSDELKQWTASFPQFVLLSAKFLWRQGYVRCPEYCDHATPREECTCSCPADLLAGRSAKDLLNTTGILDMDSSWKESVEEAGLAWDDILRLLCHVGHAGEMFTSAAPYDPLFWPLHGLAERYMQVIRYYGSEGLIELNETWGYWHLDNVASDTHTVCDWTGVDNMTLPKCTGKTTCPGHREDDLLPFYSIFPDSNYSTNAEFYNKTAPDSQFLPYVYDKLTSWPACTDGIMSPTGSRRR